METGHLHNDEYNTDREVLVSSFMAIFALT